MAPQPEWFVEKEPQLEEAMEAVGTIALSDPREEESIEWSTPIYSYRGNIFSFDPAKLLVSLLFQRGCRDRRRPSLLRG